MSDGPNPHLVRRAMAEAVIRKLNEGASHEEIARAGEAAADAEMQRILAGERPGANNPKAILAWSVIVAAIIAVCLIGIFT